MSQQRREDRERVEVGDAFDPFAVTQLQPVDVGPLKQLVPNGDAQPELDEDHVAAATPVVDLGSQTRKAATESAKLLLRGLDTDRARGERLHKNHIWMQQFGQPCRRRMAPEVGESRDEPFRIRSIVHPVNDARHSAATSMRGAAKDCQYGFSPRHVVIVAAGPRSLVRWTCACGGIGSSHQVIANAALGPGKRVLDVGCGDGLIASAAAEIVGPQGHVICSDISQDVLDLCRECATEQAVVDRCSFLKASASDLSPLDDETVDAVTVRSVLIYEPDKAAAFAEFHRVLRPHGRLSLFEPINNYGRGETPNQLLGYDITPVAGIAEQLSALYTVAAAAPMSDFNERDLVRFAEAAGFTEIHLQLNVAVRSPDPIPWRTFINIAPNPLMPSLAEAMQQVLSPADAERFTAHLRPLVETGQGRRQLATGQLWASR